MNIFFWVAFGVGVGYTVIAFLMGSFLDVADLETDVDFSGSVSPLKPSVIAAFVTVLGGSGLLLQMTGLTAFYALPAAGLCGAFVAYLMYRFVVVPLSRAQNTSAVEIQSLIGHTATVTEKIFQGGYGQIAYAENGNSYNSPAKSFDGNEIPRGSDVEIMSIEDNTYFVRKK